MPFCTNCGTKCPDGGRFCLECGTPMPPDTGASQPPPTSTTTPAVTSVRRAVGIDLSEPEVVEVEAEIVHSTTICPYCNKEAIDPLLDKIVGEQRYHLNCFNCSECGSYLGSSKFVRDPRNPGKFLCNACRFIANTTPTSREGEPGYVVNRPNMRGTGGGSDNICAKCGKTVYDREKLQYGPRKVYHKLCFTCSDCGKRIDLSSHQTANEMPYCKACFPKHSGVHLKH